MWRRAPQVSNVNFRWRLPVAYAEMVLETFYKSIVAERGREYSSSVKDVIHEVAQLLTSQDPASPKGAYLCGVCGTGKTTLLQAIQRATNYLIDRDPRYVTTEGIHIRSARELPKLEPWELRILYDHPCIGIDDLGEEPVEVMTYGNISTPIVDIIEHRYNRNLPTFFTTNLASPERYGKRVCDRLNEMVQVIVVGDNESFR